MRYLLGVSLVVGLAQAWPSENQFRRLGGFMDPVEFDMEGAARGRSLDVAEDRQGPPGGFSAPTFNIPFQPNFAFNEFGSFVDGGNGFSQLISGLGGQSLRSQSDFVQQTEQRFTRPQIGGANIGGAPFKRETNKESQKPHSSTGYQQYKQPNQPRQKRPVQRYDGFQRNVHDETSYRRPKPDSPKTFTPEPYTPKSYTPEPYTPEPYTPEPYTPEPYTPKMYKPLKSELNTRPLRLVDSKAAKRNFHHQFHEDSEFDFEEEMMKYDFENKRALQEPKKNYDEGRRQYSNQDSATVLKIESRENKFEDINGPNLKTIFDQNPLFADAEFQQSFEPERFSFAEINKESQIKKSKFNPPDLTEKFRSPLQKSQSYPFLESSIKKDKTNTKQRKVKPFANFKIVEKPKEIKKRKTEPSANVQTFSNFERFQKIPKIPVQSAVPKPTPVKQSKYENLPTFTHFKTKPSFSNFKAKPTRLSSKPRKPSKPITTTFTPPLKAFDELPSFTNFKTITENSSKKPSYFTTETPSVPTSKPFPSFINFKSQPQKRTQAPSEPPQPKTYEPTTSKTTEQSPTKQSTPSKKLYNYEKKNFREPLKQVSKNSGEHQIIRIKTPAKQELRMRPQPKQLDPPQTGFQPIVGPSSSERRTSERHPPGKLLIQEVSRRQGLYQPSDVIFDNDQPLLTLDTVQPFRAKSNPDSFAIDVKASFNPKPKQENKRPQRHQKRLMRLPSSKFSHLLHRRPVKSNKVAVAQ